MKRITIVLTALLMMNVWASAQTRELGISAGTSNFLGDLGKKEPNGKFYFGDIEASLFRPAFGVFYRHGFNKWIAVKASLTYGRLEGDDRRTDYKEIQDNDWFRNYRNLHFKSRIIEAAFVAEVHLMPYAAGSTKWRIAPYITAGIGIFNFDPKAEYNGEWVRLRPLGTEGQGIPGYGNKYSLIQPSFPIGLGLKYNVTREITIALEFGHRFTMTDYMDDVSNKYPDKADIDGFYDKVTARQVYELSRRSPENDPEGRYKTITEAGQQRGNPHGKDGYLFSMVSVSYVIGKSYLKEKNPMGRSKYQKYKRIFFDR
jgi:opacity protein-like surface antigen